MDKAATKQKKYYDKYRSNYVYRVGGLVLRDTHVLPDASKKFNAKLAPKKEAQVEIAKTISENVVLLTEPGSDDKLGAVHICQVTPYHPPEVPGLPPVSPKKSKRGWPPGSKKYNLCKNVKEQ